MKSRLFPLLLLALLCSLTAFAQTKDAAAMPDVGSPALLSATLTRLFGSVTAFTAKSEMRVLTTNQTEKMSAKMTFALLNNNVRLDMDVADMKSKDITPMAISGMKEMNMDHLVSIVRPDKKAAYTIFSGVQCYVTTSLSQEEADAMLKQSKVENTALGKETLDGHPCVKNRVAITDDKGAKTDAIAWNASDLKGFPVQIQTQEKGDTVILRFSQIQFVAPDARQFEVPSDYTSYKDPQELIQALLLKILSGALQQ